MRAAWRSVLGFSQVAPIVNVEALVTQRFHLPVTHQWLNPHGSLTPNFSIPSWTL